MRRLLLIVVAALLIVAAPAAARSKTTEVQTLGDANADNRLDQLPGEPHIVRQELAPAGADRSRTRVERLFFGQMTDTHVVDEESPLRVEFTDRLGGPFTAAYRAHEGVSAQVLEMMVRQMRNTTSPITGRPLDLVMTTGDNTDNTQLNETRWMIDVMDGDVKVNPDSGVPGACGPGGYDGVRGDDEYYEPDASDGQDGRGYSPREEENGRPSAIRDFPGLFERMNEPFQATGFGKLPWYAVFGNHDGLVQGNQPRHAALDQIATGCVKVSNLAAGTLAAIDDAADRGDGEAAIQLLRGAVIAGGSSSEIVPSDPRRKPLRKEQWIQEHFKTRGVPVGHGFNYRPESKTDGMGYYDFSPVGGVRFIVLDTVAEHGLEDGNVDHEQYLWLHEKLSQAEERHEYVIVFGHHSLGTMGQPPVSPFVPPGDTGGNLDPVVHFGEGPRFAPEPVPCAKASPSDPPDQTETIRCLLLRHPGVVAFVNGHEHNNRVDPYARREADGPVEGGFWEINTASHIDWPQQSRVVDLVDNGDGTLSLFGTILDHGAAADPGGSDALSGGGGKSGDATSRLASVSRELAFNDPQGLHQDDGEGGGRGGPSDRNVELLIRDPYAAG